MSPSRAFLDQASHVWRTMPAAFRRSILHASNDRFLVGVVGLIHDRDSRILVLEHRFRSPYPWGLPGGFIRHGESFEIGLRREIQEELGLDLDVDPPIFDTELNVAVRYISVALVAKARQTELSFSGEIIGGGFFPPGELPAETYPYHVGLVRRFWATLSHQPDPT